MSVYFGGRKAKELYFQGRKIREAWYGAKKVYTAGEDGRPIEVVPSSYDGRAYSWLNETLSRYGLYRDKVRVIPFDIDSSNVNNVSYMFYGCSSLTIVPDMDISNAIRVEAMFYGCSSLTDGNVRLIRRTGTKPPHRLRMIDGSGLTREPFFTPDGQPID